MPSQKSPLRVVGEQGRGNLLGEVAALASLQVGACYQCGKCSGGCPLAYAMDYQPRQVMRLLQCGLVEEALRSRTIWVCATCFTCTARCPRDIDIAGVMDALRVIALRRGVRPADKNIGVFHRSFLGSVRRLGRSYELGLLAAYKLGTLRLTEDVPLGLKMLAKGKLALLPEPARGRAEVEAIFREAGLGAGATPTHAAGDTGRGGGQP